MKKNLLMMIAAIVFLAAAPAQATTYRIYGDAVGQITMYTVRPNDTLYDIARGYDLGIVEVMAANPGLNPWLPPVGQVLALPTAHILPDVRQGIVINLPELRLYYFPDPYTVMTFPIGIGKNGWQTPTGTTKIVRKRANPVWIPPDSIHAETPNLPKAVAAGPDNPLGTHALNLGWPGYVIHGTNRPYGVGRRSSHGCIRLYPEDIPVLFEAVETGTKVTVIDEPYKVGWQDANLLLEVMPEQKHADEIMNHGAPRTHASVDGIESAIRNAIRVTTDVNWSAVNDAVSARNGLPTLIGFARH